MASLWLHFGLFGKSARALVVAAVFAATAMPIAARAGVQGLNLDGGSGSCNPNAEDDEAGAQEGTDVKVTFSLYGGDRSHRSNESDHPAVVFELRDAPALLVRGPPLPLELDDVLMSGAQHIATPYGDIEYVLDFPRDGGAPSGIAALPFLTAVPSLTAGLTLGEILSKVSDYFIAFRIQRQ